MAGAAAERTAQVARQFATPSARPPSGSPCPDYKVVLYDGIETLPAGAKLSTVWELKCWSVEPARVMRRPDRISAMPMQRNGHFAAHLNVKKREKRVFNLDARDSLPSSSSRSWIVVVPQGKPYGSQEGKEKIKHETQESNEEVSS
jgi:hypothetical protein